jgi:predicted ferric reductase
MDRIRQAKEKYQGLALLSLLIIVPALTILVSGKYYSLGRPAVYMLVTALVGLGLLWAIVSLRKRAEAKPETEIVPEDLKRSH